MGVKTTAKVWEWSLAEGTDRLVMLALADFCDDQDECFPGVKRIASKCLVSERTAQRSFRALEKIGELKILEKWGARTNGGATNRFQLLFPGRKGGDKWGQNGLEGGDNQGSKVVTTRAQGGDSVVTRTIREPSENHQGETAPLLMEGFRGFEDFQTAWNSLPQDFPKIQTISTGRARAIHARLKEKFWRDNWRAGLKRMAESDFLAGRVQTRAEGRKTWRASLEWFLKPDSLAKILEGRYDNKAEETQNGKPAEFWRAHL